jgi:hypothetical protein
LQLQTPCLRTAWQARKAQCVSMAAERMHISHWQVRSVMYLIVHPHRRAREAVLLLQGGVLQEDGARGLRRRLQALTRHSGF